MSKGHGRIERAILEALKWDRRSARQGMFPFGTDAETLVYYVRVGRAWGSVADPHCRYAVNGEGEIVRGTHPRPTRSELESVRRALRNLRKQGLILQTIYRHVNYMTPGKRPRSG